MKLADAIFIATLPHRQSFYKRGGWLQCDGPAAPNWNQFLNDNFSPLDLEFARGEAESYRTLELQSEESICTIWNSGYPASLKTIFDPPPVLFGYGSPLADSYDNHTAIALVGTRKPADITLAAIDEYLAELNSAHRQLTIISGLALGVDARVHRTGCKMGLPGVAVLGSGINHFGPRANRDIPISFKKSDVPFTILTEFPPHWRPFAANFPRRNRIIAGLSTLTAVMQAPFKSGAMITARYAADEGRDVAAFHHPLLSGSGHNEGARSLLSDGALAISLSGLSQRIVRQPELFQSSEDDRQAFERQRLQGELSWLGGDYYLKSGSGSKAR